MRSQSQPRDKFYKILLPIETSQEHSPTDARLPHGARILREAVSQRESCMY